MMKGARTTEEKRSSLSMANVPQATVVSVFNHKGGVGKTTLTYHMSKYLASVGHRVLMVDMDAQANLTGKVIDDETEGKVDTFYEENSQSFVYFGLSKSIPGLWTDTFEPPQGDVLPFGVPNQDADELYILGGDLRLAEIDEHLQFGLELTSTNEERQKYATCILSMLRNVQQKKTFEYIILDLPPAADRLVRLSLFSSDYILIPTEAGIFGKMAAKAVPRLIRQWDTYMVSQIGRPQPPNNDPDGIRRVPLKKPIVLASVALDKPNKRNEIQDVETLLQETTLRELSQRGQCPPQGIYQYRIPFVEDRWTEVPSCLPEIRQLLIRSNETLAKNETILYRQSDIRLLQEYPTFRDCHDTGTVNQIQESASKIRRIENLVEQATHAK
jgi:cellulose biosynthesis protein BcsQ